MRSDGMLQVLAIGKLRTGLLVRLVLPQSWRSGSRGGTRAAEITEYLEGTFQGHPVQPPCTEQGIFNQIRLLRAPSNLTLNVSRDGASTTSMGNPCQGLTILIVKNVFPISSVNLPLFGIKPFPLVLLQQALIKSLSPSFLQAPSKY